MTSLELAENSWEKYKKNGYNLKFLRKENLIIFMEKFTLFGSYDGKNFHEGFSWTANDHLTLSALMIETKYPALSVSYRFDLSKKK